MKLKTGTVVVSVNLSTGSSVRKGKQRDMRGDTQSQMMKSALTLNREEGGKNEYRRP